MVDSGSLSVLYTAELDDGMQFQCVTTAVLGPPSPIHYYKTSSWSDEVVMIAGPGLS